MYVVYKMIPGYNRLVQLWQSYSSDECKHFPMISQGPHVPLTTVLALYLFCKIIIPSIIKKRGHPFDTRPLEIVFHGFFFGVFGIAICVGLYVFKFFALFLSCKPILLPPVLVPLRSYFAIIGILVIHVYSIHFLFVALNGRKLNDIHLLYHSFSLILSTFGANYQPDENVCLYVVLELGFLAVYSMLQVMNSASIEVKENLAGIRTKVYLTYLKMRQHQYILLLVHAILHLFTDCTMKKELAFIQLCVVVCFRYLFAGELKTKLELPYCDDSYLKENLRKDNFKETDFKENDLKETDLKEKKICD